MAVGMIVDSAVGLAGLIVLCVMLHDLPVCGHNGFVLSGCWMLQSRGKKNACARQE